MEWFSLQIPSATLFADWRPCCCNQLISIFWRLGGCLGLTSGHATAMLLSTQMHEHSSWDIKRRHQGGWMSGRFRVGIAIRNKHAPVHLRCKPTLGNAFHYHLALPGPGCSFLKIEKSCFLPQVFLCFWIFSLKPPECIQGINRDEYMKEQKTKCSALKQ